MRANWGTIGKPVVASFGLLAFCASIPAQAADPIQALQGSWSGNGRLHYTDGRSENIHCTANYTGGSGELGMAIQCKSDTNPIHIRSKLKISGGRASGEWEERTFNASGTATGKVSDGTMTLSVSGGGFNGTMTVTFGKTDHSVVIVTHGIGMSKASISFKR